MKKILALSLSGIIAVTLLAGCKKGDDGGEVPTGDVKTGFAVISTIGKSADAGEKDGVGQVDSTIVAVTVDKDGKIVKCAIDAAQTIINFSTDGKITTPLDSEIKTKQELGDDYTMKKASKIGKEWNEQANALAEYVVGKTIDEVKGIKVDDGGSPSDSDLNSKVTVSIGGYVDAIEKAVKNAKSLGAAAEDKLGLGIITTIDNSTDAAEKDGVAQAYSYYAAVTVDADGKVTSTVIDASQTDVGFSKEGKVTSALDSKFETKQELGEGYNMKSKSGIGKEWNEQADAFAEYVKGKTLDEIKGIKIGEDGKATDKEITSSVTVTIGGFTGTIEKAINNAK